MHMAGSAIAVEAHFVNVILGHFLKNGDHCNESHEQHRLQRRPMFQVYSHKLMSLRSLIEALNHSNWVAG